jgi:hypothetical protein
MFEPMEPRILLSGDLSTFGVSDALYEGMGKFGAVVNDFVLQEPLLDVQLPVVVQSGGDNLLNDFIIAPTIEDLLRVEADADGDGSGEAGLYDTALDIDGNSLDTDGNLILDFSELFLGKFIGDLRDYLVAPQDLDGDGKALSSDLLIYLDDQARDINEVDTRYISQNYADRSYDLQVDAAQDLSADNAVAWQLDFTLLFTNEMALDLGYQAGGGGDRQRLLHLGSRSYDHRSFGGRHQPFG